MAKKKQNSNGSHESRNDESPLRIFDEAKESIRNTYSKLDECVKKTFQFYTTIDIEEATTKSDDIHQLERIIENIKIIREVLARNQMKVAFFGRTSNGKSTVINAILHDKVLPMGIGHTTGCFLQIQGNQENEAFLQGQDQERRPIQSVSNIANALNTESLEYSTLVKIQWPISKCPLLKHEVVLVDSPGVDVEKNLDQWIDQHCHDADVFVLVSHAESTLTNAEKNFFHKVSEKLSKPNLFILINRWDAIADYPECMGQVKQQHVKRAIDFLADELRVSSREEAEQRTFFVSAKETLQARCPGQNNSNHLEGYEDRMKEFKNFERRFEESLSKSAVKTKFKKHTDKGQQTINDLSIILRRAQNLVKQAYGKKLEELRHNEERYKCIQNLFYANEDDLKQKIVELKKNIEISASTEFDVVIRRLARIVDDFESDFSLNYDKMKFYKEQLYLHVEKEVSENLKSRIETVINKQVTPLNNAMYNIGSLLPEARQRRVNHVVGAQTYVRDDLINLKYKHLYSGFQEDLEFRFSLGLDNIIKKFHSKFSLEKTVFESFLMLPPQSPTTVGSLAISGILFRSVGWRVIVITTVVYGALYAYEYLTWTKAAKEKTFKAQYVRYAKKGLQDCVPIISDHIANHIGQTMTNTFSDFKAEVDGETKEIYNRVGFLRNSLENLRKCGEFTRALIGENEVLLNEFVTFASSFLTV